MNLFGTAKKKPAAEVDVNGSIMRLRDTLSILEKKEDILNKKIANETSEAKKALAAGNKRGATSCLKRRKMLEGQIHKLEGARETIENQVRIL
jgi:charged multivesicular body protein 4